MLSERVQTMELDLSVLGLALAACGIGVLGKPWLGIRFLVPLDFTNLLLPELDA